MELLVSVVNEEQAEIAAVMGVQWLDLKDPTRGPLGMASGERQRAVLERLRAWPGRRRSVALGEIVDHDLALALPQPQSGFQFAKLGTARVMHSVAAMSLESSLWWQRWIKWYQLLPSECQGVLVAYADASACQGLGVDAALDLARRFNLPYLLVDTFDKSAGGLFAILQREGGLPQIRRWIDQAKQQGTRLAWAGQLSRDEVLQLANWQADIVGVRSAVCERDERGVPIRSGGLCPNRLRQLLSAVGSSQDPASLGGAGDWARIEG